MTPDQPDVDATGEARFPQRLRMARVTGLLGAVLLWMLVAAPASRAQSEPIVINSEGGNTGFLDEDDPSKVILVFFGGVDIAMGNRRMQGETLVAVLQRGEDESNSSTLGPGQSILPDSRVVELFVDGNVTLEEGDEQVLGAQSIYVDNLRNTLTILDGRVQATVGNSSLVVRYEVMYQLANGVKEMEGVSYTTCDFAHAHWSMDAPWARLVPTEEGRVLHTSWNSIQAGGVPFMWLPAIHYNIDRDRPPLRSVGFGTSRKYGTAITTTWGGDSTELATSIGNAFGVEGRVKSEWELELNNYSKRGVFYQPKWTYETKDSKGTLFGSFINDRANRDDLEEPIFDHTRGRIDLEHRTKIDEHRTVDVELSYVSDQNYLREYYEHEERVDKPPETYIAYRDVVDNEAFTAIVKARVNNYQTQVEYLPRVGHRLTGQQVDTGFLGTAYFTSMSFADNAALRGSKLPPEDFGEPAPTQPDSQRNLRAGTRGLLQWPLDVGEDRVTVTGGYDLTYFENTAKGKNNIITNDASSDSSSAVRYALLGGVEWLRTYSGTAEYESDLWNIDGVRQILEPRVAYESVLELNEDPDDLLLIDNTETLVKRHAFIVGFRHRIQTHQHGEVVTILDTDISMPFFPDENQDNLVPSDETTPNLDEFDGQTNGPLRIDVQWKPGADIPGLRQATVRWRSVYDTIGWKNIESFASYSSDFGDDQRFIIAQNKVRHVSDFLTTGVQWILTPRWTIAAYDQEDLLLNQNARRGIILRQQAHRWLIDVEVSRRRGRSRVDTTSSGRRNQNDTQFTISFRPSFASGSETLLDQIGRIR